MGYGRRLLELEQQNDYGSTIYKECGWVYSGGEG